MHVAMAMGYHLYLPCSIPSLLPSWVPIDDMVQLVDTEYTNNAGKKAGINMLERRVGACARCSGCIGGQWCGRLAA